MNEHTLRVLEYEKVLGIVAGYAATEAGRMSVLGLQPETDHAAATTSLLETSEFIRILQSGESPPLDGIFDIGSAIAKLGATGSMLSPVELLQTAETLSAGRRVKQFFHKLNGLSTAPLLTARADTILPLKHLEDAVFSAIDERAEVKDSASPDLRRIRKQLARVRDDVLSRMSRMLQDSGFQKVIQEPVITIRDDRFVLPLKPGFRQSIQGVVHGQSGSRSTLFVEPLEVLEQNNRLAELRLDEREEIERILRDLTSLLAREAGRIEVTIKALVMIDAVYARAKFGMVYDGTIATLTKERGIRLRNARHPLLAWKQKSVAGGAVLGNDFELSTGERALVISGPNAGGKTVILKTVGLLSLMAQTGLPITAAEGSVLPCFSSLFADIGDEQSIEQDLSTFSSHVSQIAQILQKADDGSLVLLDELGSGTEPGEGAGLGAAVLETLIERGSVTLVTTHHNALKLFGTQAKGAVNAAMEFDPNTLKPTYRLIPGRPGRSYGLDMAGRLGIPAAVIDNARARIGEHDTKLEDLLKHVEEESRMLASERQALEQDRSAALHEREEAATLLKAVREEALNTRTQARTEAREVVSLLRQKLRELSRSAALEQADIKKTSTEAESLYKKLEPPVSDLPVPGSVSNIRKGDRVRITRLNKTGTVLTLHRNMLELDVAGKKIRLAATEVLPAEPESRTQTAATISGWSADLTEDEGAPDRLNIIGLRVADGLAEVDRFIDHAGLNHLSMVTVIHGLGTGALKSAVTGFLKGHPLIAAIRTGEPAEGGAGVTVAELKK